MRGICFLQDGVHDLKSLGSGGMRLGPVSLVRAVGRVIRSVVGGDSDDSHQHQVHLLACLQNQSFCCKILCALPETCAPRISHQCHPAAF